MIADFKSNGEWMKYAHIDGKYLVTYSYQRWNAMRQRCKEGGSQQGVRPTYVGCEMSPMFSDFQRFVDWHVQQVGYSEKGYQLDKDILFEGNKLYSEDTCVLVPASLNGFLIDRGAARGEFPQGVSRCRGQGYRASINSSGKRKHIGHYTTPEAASCAYKLAKEAEARRWYERLKAGEFIVDNRVIERMCVWTVLN